ncbi:MAG: hypothetical protein AB3N33_02305 [Puniceicoccaceae bacterium]
MKRRLSFFFIACVTSTLGAQTSILVDFGQVDLPSGPETDPNGYYWNNPVVVAAGVAKGNWIGWELLSESERIDQPWAEVVEYWSDYVGYPYVLVADMVDQTGTATGSSLIITDVSQRVLYDNPVNDGGFGWAGHIYGDDLGPIPTDTGYAGTATADSWYVNFDFLATIVVTGLDDAKTYTVKLWGGHGIGENRRSLWGVAGQDKQSVETNGNTGSDPSDYGLFENVSPVNGEITITFEQGSFPNNLLPNGHMSTLEIIGDFSAGETTWYGYPIVADNWVDTGAWLGWVNISFDPWVWVDALSKYVYIGDDSGWVYIPQ